MRKGAIVAVLLAAGLPAWATTAVEDTDGDGSYSLAELQAAYPGLSEDLFDEIDLDGDGVISAEELADARDAEILE